MAQNRAQVELDSAWEFIGPYLPGLDIVNQDINVSAGMPAWVHESARAAEGHLVRAASALPGRITLLPSRYNLRTASGIALLAHELEHQRQFQRDPHAMDRYAIEQARVEANGLAPWENAYEKPAYRLEARVYREALTAGYPPGDHQPLLISRGLAAMEAEGEDDLLWKLFVGGVLLTGLAINVVRFGRETRHERARNP